MDMFDPKSHVYKTRLKIAKGGNQMPSIKKNRQHNAQKKKDKY